MKQSKNVSKKCKQDSKLCFHKLASYEVEMTAMKLRLEKEA